MCKEIVSILVFFLSMVCHAHGQVTATASVGSTIVSPISMAKTVDMNFGNAAVSASTGGILVLSPSGSRSTVGSGVTLPATAGTVSAAGFYVSGMANYTFSISLPVSATITGPGSSALMIESFSSTPSVTGTLNTSGVCALAVGASLSIAAGQPAGVYVNESAVPVTVNYN